MSPVKTAMVFNLLVLILNGILGLSPGRNEWVQWKLRHGKTYPSVHVEQEHMAIWMENYRFVQEHTSRSDVTFTVKLNSLADQVRRESAGVSLGLTFIYELPQGETRCLKFRHSFCEIIIVKNTVKSCSKTTPVSRQPHY